MEEMSSEASEKKIKTSPSIPNINLPKIKEPKLSRKLLSRLALLAIWIAAVSVWSFRFYTGYSEATVWLHDNMWLVLSFAIFALGDDITTAIALRQTNGEGELNPIANAVFKKKHGKLLFTSFKWLLMALLIIILASSEDYKATVFITVAYGLVVLNNVRAILEYIICPDIVKQVRAIPMNTRMYLIRIGWIFAIAGFVAYGAEYII